MVNGEPMIDDDTYRCFKFNHVVRPKYELMSQDEKTESQFLVVFPSLF
jgi:hypothetical protein